MRKEYERPGEKLYKAVVEPVLLSKNLSPETAHMIAIESLKALGIGRLGIVEREFDVRDPMLETEFCNIGFKNPVGLAAGFCKNPDKKTLRALCSLGFGHIEVGTITQYPRKGNPKPRLWRIKEEGAIINHMGMNNPGAEVVGKKMEKLGEGNKVSVPVIVSIAGSKTDRNMGDPVKVYENLYPNPGIGLFGFNISCPNQFDFCLEQMKGFSQLSGEVQDVRKRLELKYGYRPTLLKISPDMNFESLDGIVNTARESGFDGIVATNTTQAREKTGEVYSRKGGLSGPPLRERSTRVIAHVKRNFPDLEIIGVGGIGNAQDAWEKIRAGASLVQIFTSMIFEGPYVVRRINLGLVELMEREGVKNIREVVGVDANKY